MPMVPRLYRRAGWLAVPAPLHKTYHRPSSFYSRYTGQPVLASTSNGNQRVWFMEKMLEFSSTVSTMLSLYLCAEHTEHILDHVACMQCIDAAYCSWCSVLHVSDSLIVYLLLLTCCGFVCIVVKLSLVHNKPSLVASVVYWRHIWSNKGRHLQGRV